LNLKYWIFNLFILVGKQMCAWECWLFSETELLTIILWTIKPRTVWSRDWNNTVWFLDETVFYLLGYNQSSLDLVKKWFCFVFVYSFLNRKYLIFVILWFFYQTTVVSVSLTLRYNTANQIAIVINKKPNRVRVQVTVFVPRCM